jgi:hypothetical protein
MARLKAKVKGAVLGGSSNPNPLLFAEKKIVDSKRP